MNCNPLLIFQPIAAQVFYQMVLALDERLIEVATLILKLYNFEIVCTTNENQMVWTLELFQSFSDNIDLIFWFYKHPDYLILLYSYENYWNCYFNSFEIQLNTYPQDKTNRLQNQICVKPSFGVIIKICHCYLLKPSMRTSKEKD